MRERWAIALALLSGALIVLMSAVFAVIQNPPQPPAPAVAPAVPLQEPQLAAGRAVFDRQGCARCHSIAGEGSPRSALDGVGGRRTREELRDWATGSDVVAGELAPRVLATKQGYADLPEQELEALLDYLASLR